MAEVKRMWITPSARGQGISKALLARIELEAVAECVVALLLETGVENHAAPALYEGAGFKVRGPFADYVLDPLSVFMESCSGRRTRRVSATPSVSSCGARSSPR